jgi:hemoglobin-like flavoprotein
MKTELITETWGALDERQQHDFVEAFYRRFFERFPGYRRHFPQELNPAHLEKMVQTMALVANLSEERGLIAPHMHKVGAAHEPYALKPGDLETFKVIFVEMLGEQLGEQWSLAAAQAWGEAFDQVLIPLMHEGMAGARTPWKAGAKAPGAGAKAPGAGTKAPGAPARYH